MLAIGIPLLGAGLIFIITRKGTAEIGSIITFLILGVDTFVVFQIYNNLNRGRILELKISTGLPFPLHFRADALGIFLSLIATSLWLLASLYSIEYLKHRKTLFNVFLLLSLYGMLGITLTGNLFSLLLFFEFFSVSSYVLVIHEGTPEARRAGFRYLFMSVVGSVCLLVATVVTYNIAGTINLSGLGIFAQKTSPFLPWIFWLYIAGFGVKAGAFPVHVWLPEAHPIAPSPASALLSGIMIKAGAYGIIRTVYGIFGTSLITNLTVNKSLLIIAVVTMMLGSIMALTQTELKRLLAYSSIAQIGYVILGVALLSEKGLTGGILHIFNHALMKGTLFLCAGAIIFKSGLRNLEDLEGIGKRMPLTMFCFTLAALSMIGIPPFSGFISKWLLALGALEAANDRHLISQWAGIAIIASLLLSSLLNVV